jgi:hypothetical protein
MKVSLYLIISMSFLTGCVKNININVDKVKAHSQKVVKSLYKDTVFSYLQSKYLPPNDTRVLIKQFRDYYRSETLKGGLIYEQYHKNFPGNDEVTFIHQYKSENKIVKINMRYILIKDTFELKSLIFYNSALQ